MFSIINVLKLQLSLDKSFFKMANELHHNIQITEIFTWKFKCEVQDEHFEESTCVNPHLE